MIVRALIADSIKIERLGIIYENKGNHVYLCFAVNYFRM